MPYHLSNPCTYCCIGRSLAIGFLLAFVIKLGLLVIVIPHFRGNHVQLYNFEHIADGYNLIARNLILGNGYRFYPETAQTMMRGPGYVFLLAGIMCFVGKSIIAIKVVNLLLSMATAYFTALTCTKYMNGSMRVWIPPLLFLFHPGTILAESRGGLESFLTFTIVLFMFWLYRSIETNRRSDYMILGCILGVSLLIKSSTLFFPVLLFPYLLWVKRSNTGLLSIFTNFALVVTGMLLLLTPWIVRNYSITGKFVPLTTLRGLAMFQGLYVNKNVFSEKEHHQLLTEAAALQDSFANEAGLRFRTGFYQFFYLSTDEVSFDKILFDRVKDDYSKTPLLLLKSCFLNSLRFWFQGKTKKATFLNVILTGPFLILVIAGTYAGYKNGMKITPILIIIGSYILLHLPTIAVARYYIPIIPLLAILASLIPFRMRKSSDS